MEKKRKQNIEDKHLIALNNAMRRFGTHNGNKFQDGGLGTIPANINTPMAMGTPQVKINSPSIQDIATLPQMMANMQHTTDVSGGFAKSGGSGMSGIMGGTGSVLSGVTSLFPQGAANLHADAASTLTNEMTATNKGSLASEAENNPARQQAMTNPGGQAVSGAITGAQAGAKFGAVGTVTGSIIGAASGLFTSIIGNKKRAIQNGMAETMEADKVNAQNMKLNDEDLAAAKRNIAAYGGQFSNGMTEFNVGGRHETNPMGGIIQGLDPQGKPNLVEEGEVKWNNYIFSDRLKVPGIVQLAMFPKNLENKTFAEAAESIGDESKERELDPISQKGLNSGLSKLAALQEMIREMEGVTDNFSQGGKKAKGGKLGNRYDGYDDTLPTQGLSLSQPGYSSIGATMQRLVGNTSLGATTPSLTTPITPITTPTVTSTTTAKKAPFEWASKTTSGTMGVTRDQFDAAMDAQGLTDQGIKDNAWKIATRESGNHLDAYRVAADNPGGGNDQGFFQINSKWQPEATSTYDLKSLNGQIAAFKDIYTKEGWRPWFTKLAEEDKYTTTPFSSQYANQPRAIQGVVQNSGNNPNLQAAATPALQAQQAKADYTTPMEQQQWYKDELARRAKIDQRNQDAHDALQAEADKRKPITTLMRLAPAASDAAKTVQAATSTPDYMSPQLIHPQRLTDRMAYKPLDSNYLLNQVVNQGNRASQDIYNTSGGNRAIAQAGLLASNATTQKNIGDAIMNADETNYQRLAKVKAFNQELDKYNITNDLSAQKENAAERDKAWLTNMQNKAARENAIRAGLASLSGSIGKMGKEMRDEDVAALTYRYNQYGEKATAAFGGNIPLLNKDANIPAYQKLPSVMAFGGMKRVAPQGYRSHHPGKYFGSGGQAMTWYKKSL